MIAVILLLICFAQVRSQIELKCVFSNRSDPYVPEMYNSCNLLRILVLEKYEDIFIDGYQVEGKSDLDVTGVVMEFSITSYIIPELFLKFPSLKFFYINYNELHHLPSHVFSTAPNLQTMYIHYANLQTVDEDAFIGLRSLKRLSLAANKISYLPKAVFYPLQSLTYLKLNHNSLVRLHNEMFLQNGAFINEILLQNNQIREIGPNFLDNLVALNTIYLNANNCTNTQYGKGNAPRIDFPLIRKALEACMKNYNSTQDSNGISNGTQQCL